MSKWKNKYVIGLTGNIGTGKSIVRKMLENLGAYGIDADTLSHRAMAKGAPGYEPIVRMFGQWILKPDQQIDRAKLARLVFSDPEALKILEGIIHPLVKGAINLLVQRSSQDVIVIEAIKLLEAKMDEDCDSIWVTYSTPEQQLERLIKFRSMDEQEALQRINAQPPQERKLAVAHVVIKNTGTYEDTWRQVNQAWERYIGERGYKAITRPLIPTKKGAPELIVNRARPSHVREIAAFFNHFSNSGKKYEAQDIMAAFGEKAFLLLQADQRILGLVGWQVENLIARTTDILISPSIAAEQAIPILLSEMEAASRDLQCEASLLYVPAKLATNNQIWQQNGYLPRRPEDLDNQTWQEAARESMVPNTTMFFKQLRQDRVLRPI